MVDISWIIVNDSNYCNVVDISDSNYCNVVSLSDSNSCTVVIGSSRYCHVGSVVCGV